MIDDNSESLQRTADHIPETPDRLGGVLRRRAARVRRARITVVSAAVVASVTAAALYTSLEGKSSRPAISPANPAGEQLFSAEGRVVHVLGEPDRACVPLAEATDLITRPAPATCPIYGVEVEGVDFSDLQNRREQDGAIEGYATLEGHLRGNVLVVTKQSLPGAYRDSTFRNAPCPPPPGGWPPGAGSGNPDLSAAKTYQRDHPDDIVMLAIARPDAATSVVYVMTKGDPQPVEDALRPAYGKSLCVARASYSVSERTAAVDEIRAKSQEFKVFMSSGGSLSLSGQPVVQVAVVRMTPKLKQLVDSYPVGLIEIEAWLHPVA